MSETFWVLMVVLAMIGVTAICFVCFLLGRASVIAEQCLCAQDDNNDGGDDKETDPEADDHPAMKKHRKMYPEDE